MKSSYIPEILKEKISLAYRVIYSLLLFLVCIFSAAALLSFNINDNSFLTSTSNISTNLLGDLGSYYASFIFYSFGLLGYLIALFFFIYSISTWGVFAHYLHNLHDINYLNYILSIIGLSMFIFSQNIFQLFKFPKINIVSVIKKSGKTELNKTHVKKDPIINTVLQTNDNENEEYKDDNNLEIDYLSPSLEILDTKNQLSKSNNDNENMKANSELLEKVFDDFNIDIEVVNVKYGPVVTLFEILPAAGTKINTIINLADDISRSMGVGAVRIAQIFGTQFLGVEVPNEKRETITIKELLSDSNFTNTSHKIPLCIGKDISGNIEVIDLSKTPHLLVAGTTGSGKSVFINTLLASILYKFSPEEMRLILIDPKMLELSVYNDIAHLLTPVVTEPKKAIIALKWVCKEMERRYSLMNEENTRSLEGYNQKSIERLPYIVVFIDEMADLMMTAGKEVEHHVQRLAQMARACGIHLVMATQRPSVDIITGSIKANFPSRISFQVASKYDSRTVLGETGAEQLLGNGDMLMSKNGGNIIRYQSAFISDNEVNKLIGEIKKNKDVNYLDELDEIIKNNDESFDSLSDEDEVLISKSIDLIRSTNKASTSFLQRNFQIGYNKAARIMEALEQRGVVSEPNHTGKREILIKS